MGDANAKVGRQPIICPNFTQKLHENERNWSGGVSGAPLDPPMKSPDMVWKFKLFDTHSVPPVCKYMN